MNKISKIKELVQDIVSKDLLKKDPTIFKRRKVYTELKVEFVKIFDDALKDIKPVTNGKMLCELFNKAAPWISYSKFNWEKYLRLADNKFYQLKKEVRKNNIDLHLEYNMTYNQMWIACSIDINDGENSDDDLVLFDSELYLDTIFYNEILDKIFNKLEIYPIVLEKCFPQMSEDFELKGWSRNWDT